MAHNESDTQTYRLIKGKFLPDEVRQVLMTLIDDKINFHHRNDYSRRERFSETDAAGAQRVDELQQSKADLAAAPLATR